MTIMALLHLRIKTGIFNVQRVMKVNSSQVKIKYEISKPFRSKCFSKDGNHAESEQFL